MTSIPLLNVTPRTWQLVVAIETTPAFLRGQHRPDSGLLAFHDFPAEHCKHQTPADEFH